MKSDELKNELDKVRRKINGELKEKIIYNEQSVVGKTIQIVEDDPYGLVFVFTDKTFIMLHSSDDEVSCSLDFPSYSGEAVEYLVSPDLLSEYQYILSQLTQANKDEANLKALERTANMVGVDVESLQQAIEQLKKEKDVE